MREQVNYPSTVPTDMTAIYAVESPQPGVPEPIRHRYDVYMLDDCNEPHDTPSSPAFVATIQFQQGPRFDPTSRRGLFLMHLYAIAIDWLERAQRTVYACDTNAEALTHTRAALAALQRRRDERAARGVLGTVQR